MSERKHNYLYTFCIFFFYGIGLFVGQSTALGFVEFCGGLCFFIGAIVLVLFLTSHETE